MLPRNPKILFVEDHTDTSTVMRQLLTHDGYEVTVACNAEEAVQACERMKFDLAVCDIGLPGTDGWMLMPELTRRFSLPGIALSGYGLPSDVEKSREAGFLLHLTKPVAIEHLTEVIDQILNPDPAEVPTPLDPPVLRPI